MSAISAISSAATQTAIATTSLPSAAADTSSQTDSSSANQPAVIVSLSSAAGGTQHPQFARPQSDQVAFLLNMVAGANAEANIAASISDAGYARLVGYYGVAIANRDLGEVYGGAALVAKDAIAGAAGLGIQVQDSVNPDAVANGAAPGTLSISAFSFTADGNKFAITPGTDGSFVESENGQTLYSFQGRNTDDPSTESVADIEASYVPVAANPGAAVASPDLTKVQSPVAPAPSAAIAGAASSGTQQSIHATLPAIIAANAGSASSGSSEGASVTVPLIIPDAPTDAPTKDTAAEQALTTLQAVLKQLQDSNTASSTSLPATTSIENLISNSNGAKSLAYSQPSEDLGVVNLPSINLNT